ncbi:hypothetical protein Y1Q_0018917 [Alligator mississippiensis]|uniref:Uncharacterized protein n=1 Tax=Alligator mississippiensis TaxID=8496 RepID=A0A151M344_ALLMI|nr:hypothetical protein Y1Q_0018917 [Alligator mississippiensis]
MTKEPWPCIHIDFAGPFQGSSPSELLMAHHLKTCLDCVNPDLGEGVSRVLLLKKQHINPLLRFFLNLCSATEKIKKQLTINSLEIGRKSEFSRIFTSALIPTL